MTQCRGRLAETRPIVNPAASAAISRQPAAQPAVSHHSCEKSGYASSQPVALLHVVLADYVDCGAGTGLVTRPLRVYES